MHTSPSPNFRRRYARLAVIGLPLCLLAALLTPGLVQAQSDGSINVVLRADPPTGVDVEVYATNLATSRAPLYRTRWGGPGMGPGLFDIPIDVAVAPDGAVYVADLGQCSIQKFDAQGQHLATWERCGLSTGLFYDLDTIAVGPDGDLFAADSKLFQTDVHRFDGNGNHELTWQLGYSFILPGGLAVDASGHVYVTEASHNRVKKFDANGNQLLTWGTSGTIDGRFAGPLGVATDSLGNVYVVDSGNNRVQKFTDTGLHLATWDAVFAGGALPPGLFDVAVDSHDHVYVSDSANNRIYKLTGDGELIVAWGGWGQAPGQFDGPSGLAVSDDDRLYVLDANSSTVHAYADSMRRVDDAVPDDGDGLDATATYSGLDAGVYRVTTRLPYGWTFDEAGCTDSLNTPIPGGRQVELQAGANVTCTVDIVGPGEITFVNEVADGNAGPTAWRYDVITTTQISALPTSVPHQTPTLLPRGAFTATVHGPNGYAPAAATGACSLVDGAIVIHVATSRRDTCTVRYATISAVHVTETFGVTTAAEGAGVPDDHSTCFWLTTATAPDAALTLAVLPRDGQVRTDHTLLPITPSNWNNTSVDDPSNLVCVEAVDDAIADDDAIICKDATTDILGTGAASGPLCGDHLAYIDVQIFESYDPAYTAATPFRSNTTDDLDGDAKTVEILLQNDDVPGVRITPAYGVLHVDESGAPVDVHCYWLNLTSEPTADVAVTVNATDPQIEATPAVVTLDADDWDILDWRFTTNQICVRAVDDPRVDASGRFCAPRNARILADGDISGEVCGDHLGHLRHVVSSADPRYDGLTDFTSASPDFDDDAQTLDVLVRDDDAAGVTFTPATLNLVEGTEGSYTAVLTSQPDASVLVIQETQQVAFDASNWDMPQTLQVGVAENDLVDGSRQVEIDHAVLSADSNYNGIIPAPVLLAVADNDSAGVELATPDQSGRVAVVEGGAGASYGLRLTAAPSTALTLTLAAGDQLTFAPASLHFDGSNWDVWQQVTVQAVDDPLIERTPHTSLLFHRIDSDDPAFQGRLGPTVSVDISDNDRAGLVFEELTAMTVTEDGTLTAELAVSAAGRPTATVTVNLDGAPQLTVAPHVLTFAPEAWNQPQTVTIQAVDNAVDSGDSDTAWIAVTVYSEDGHYDSLRVAARAVTVLDDDHAAVQITPTALTTPMGAEARYNVRLLTEPTTPVLVLVQPPAAAGLDVLAEPCSGVMAAHVTCLVFTPDTWQVAQSVAVQGVREGGYQLAHQVDALDPQYANLPAPSVNITVAPASETPLRSVFLPYVMR